MSFTIIQQTNEVDFGSVNVDFGYMYVSAKCT